MQVTSKVGEIGINKRGEKMTIVEYVSCTNIKARFDNGYITNRISYGNFKAGSVRSSSALPKGDKCRSTWLNMITRCRESWQKSNPTYIGCKCSDEWLVFGNLEKWYNENIYETDEPLQLDKDILYPNNKIYSADTCALVPRSINLIFTKRQASRKGVYPMGVIFNKKTGKYQAHCGVGTCTTKKLGLFNTTTEAFNAYKDFKEYSVKNLAYKYSESIPETVYKALLAYQVNIED